MIKKLRLVDDSDKAWREYGLNDPYFGVLTDEKFRKNNLTATRLNEFFESGEHHVKNLLATLNRVAVTAVRMNSALDFGCGVGRIVVPLALRFEGVVGIDISEAYLAEARRNCEKRGVTNAQFSETLAPLLEEHRHFDLVHSTIVFNHIPWKRGKEIICDLFKLLRPEGAMAVQIMLRRQTTWMRRLGSWGRRNFIPLNWLTNWVRGRPTFEPLMQGNEYPLHELLPLLGSLGAHNFHIELDTTPEGHVFALIYCARGPAGLAGDPE